MWQCNECTHPAFATGSELNKHIVFEHEKGEFRCRQCQFTADLRATVYQHYVAVHPNCPLICAIRMYEGEPRLPRGGRQSKPSKRGLPIRECGQVFAKKTLLEKHERAVHFDRTPFICRVKIPNPKRPQSNMFCSEKFATHRSALRHAVLQHGTLGLTSIQGISEENLRRENPDAKIKLITTEGLIVDRTRNRTPPNVLLDAFAIEKEKKLKRKQKRLH